MQTFQQLTFLISHSTHELCDYGGYVVTVKWNSYSSSAVCAELQIHVGPSCSLWLFLTSFFSVWSV